MRKFQITLLRKLRQETESNPTRDRFQFLQSYESVTNLQAMYFQYGGEVTLSSISSFCNFVGL